MQPPFFSIIIPTHGRDAALDRCLKAVSRLDYPSECCEVIVVYDGSIPIQHPKIGQFSVQLLTQPKSGPAAARNKGAIQAGGDYLAFTDDDCIPTADWLSRLSAAFVQYPERMVGGRVVNALPENTMPPPASFWWIFSMNDTTPIRSKPNSSPPTIWLSGAIYSWN